MLDATVVLEKNMRIIARFEKGKAVRFVSHLDIQRTFQRAFRRANIPLAYSQGFNPHPQLSFAAALALGYTSEAEWLDVKLAQAMEPASFQAAANAAVPAGFRILEVIEASENAPALTALMEAAEYTIEFQGFNLVSGPKELETAFASMVAGPIFVDKRTKGGIKTVDIRPLLLNYQFSLSADGCPLLTLLGVADAKGSLNIDLLLGALRTFCAETTYTYNVHRKVIYFKSGSPMPALPHK